MTEVVRLLLLILGIAISIFAAAATDLALTARHFIDENPPQYGLYNYVRLAAAILLSAALLSLVRRWNKELHSGELDGPANKTIIALTSIAVLGALFLGAFIAMDPVKFNAMAIEDSFFEWGSAGSLGLACIFAIAAMVRFFRGRSYLLSITSAIIAVVLLLMCMEELSWFQRVLAYKTPAAIRLINQQREVNLHNIYTNLYENLYYGGTFICLVLLPSAFFLFRQGSPFAVFRSLMPSRYVSMLAAMTTTFSWGMWNIFWFQAAFAYCVLYLLSLAVESGKKHRLADRWLFSISTAILLVCHGTVLIHGANMIRSWDDTELKELIIALSFLLYSVEIYWRACKSESLLLRQRAIGDVLSPNS